MKEALINVNCPSWPERILVADHPLESTTHSTAGTDA